MEILKKKEDIIETLGKTLSIKQYAEETMKSRLIPEKGEMSKKVNNETEFNLQSNYFKDKDGLDFNKSISVALHSAQYFGSQQETENGPNEPSFGSKNNRFRKIEQKYLDSYYNINKATQKSIGVGASEALYSENKDEIIMGT